MPKHFSRLLLSLSTLLVAAAPVMAVELFWTDLDTNQVLRGTTDGTEPVVELYGFDDYPPFSAPTSGGRPMGLVVEGEMLLWADEATDQILKGSVDGSGPVVELYSRSDYPGTPSAIRPQDLIVDGRFVYWTDMTTGQVLRGPLDGTGPVIELFNSQDYPTDIIRCCTPRGIALDGGFVYWTDDSTNHILRGSVDGNGTCHGDFWAR